MTKSKAHYGPPDASNSIAKVQDRVSFCEILAAELVTYDAIAKKGKEKQAKVDGAQISKQATVIQQLEINAAATRQIEKLLADAKEALDEKEAALLHQEILLKQKFGHVGKLQKRRLNSFLKQAGTRAPPWADKTRSACDRQDTADHGTAFHAYLTALTQVEAASKEESSQRAELQRAENVGQHLVQSVQIVW